MTTILKTVSIITLLFFVFSQPIIAEPKSTSLMDAINSIQKLPPETDCSQPVTSSKRKGKKSNVDPSCKTNKDDPFEIGARALDGIDKGKCLKTNRFRPMELLTAAQMKEYGFTPSTKKVVVANFNHNGKFYVAEIPIKEINNTKMMVTHFGGVPGMNFGHAHSRMNFNKPIKLVEQYPKTGKTTQTNDLVMSVHATTSDNGYDPIKKGFDGSYSNSYALFSLESKARHIAKNGYKVNQYQMNLTKSEQERYLSDYIKKSDKAGLSEIYNTGDNNCGTGHLGILDRIHKPNPAQQKIMNDRDFVLTEINPAHFDKALGARGLIKGTKLPDLQNDPYVAEYFKK